MKERFISLFPYKGGKTVLVAQVVSLIEWAMSHYHLKAYCEACGGSAKYTTNLSLPYEINKTYVELDLGVVKLVTVLQNKVATDLLIKRLLSFNYTEEEFYYMKANYAREDIDIITAAAYTYIFIHLSWRNALTNFGEEKILGKKNYFRRGIRNIASKRFDIALKDVNILQGDCLDYIDNNMDNSDLFISLDVPYPDTTGYPSNERHGEFDYQRMISLLLETKSKILINGYDTKMYDELLKKGWHKVKVINKRYKQDILKAEYLWINFDISAITRARLNLEYTF